MITVLAGGVGAARFLRGLVLEVDPTEISVVVNTGDDTIMHGLNISPDLDTVTYTVANAIDPGRGWGLANESWRVMESLVRYQDVKPQSSSAAGTWFNLGDRDLATHLYRTARIAEGATLATVTEEIARAWGLNFRMIPMSNGIVSTKVDIVEDGHVSTVSFQEYFVQRRHSVPVTSVQFVGASTAQPIFLDLLHTSEAIIIAPSNPIVSLGPIRALSGVDQALASNRDRVVAISPIVAGSALKGPADRMLTELGHEASVVGVARIYAPVCSTLVIDQQDEALQNAVEREGMKCVIADTIMRTPEITQELARKVLQAARSGQP
ncbi:MAG: LPPG--FO 2-phopspho-L-lactate transferase [actinobacterium acAcidi]|nr:MAG: LPPG--FO 2-phopspho-L-lactate transferase [actinobacterium acAcidi]